MIEKFKSSPYREYIPDEFSAYLDGHYEISQDITYVLKCAKCGKIFKDTVTVTLGVQDD